MIKAIDLANYTQVPTPEQVRCLLDAGYTKAIIGSSYGARWQLQTAAFEAGGIDVEQYCFPSRITWTRPYWLDCETAEATVDLIRAVCGSPTPPIGIYSRRGFWTAELGDWGIKREFSWLKLWDASYGSPPPAFVPYGGFVGRAMHQWHDSTELCGLNVDLNICEEEADMPLTDEDKRTIAEIVKLQIELARQDMEKTGQIRLRK